MKARVYISYLWQQLITKKKDRIFEERQKKVVLTTFDNMKIIPSLALITASTSRFLPSTPSLSKLSPNKLSVDFRVRLPIKFSRKNGYRLQLLGNRATLFHSRRTPHVPNIMRKLL